MTGKIRRVGQRRRHGPPVRALRTGHDDDPGPGLVEGAGRVNTFTPEQMRALADLLSKQGDVWGRYGLPSELNRSSAAALLAAADQIDAARTEVQKYAGWYEYSPEDSWRFERDIRAALGMEQYSGDEQ